MSYADYLKSKDWKNKKRRKFRRSQSCAICRETENLHVHHLFYRRRIEDALQSDLRILCEKCHRATHDLIASGEMKLKLSKIENHTKAFEFLKSNVLAYFGAQKLNEEMRQAILKD